VLCAFAVVFIALTVGSYTQKSATTDEPQHLTAGYTALRLHDYRIDPEHPPFLRMWAALPLMMMADVKLDTNTVSWQTGQNWDFSHHFLYELNDADHLLYRARFMTVLLGILLGALVFSWAQELFGFWTAAAVLALYCFEPNILAHSSLVTTDLGVTCFIFGALYFLWRLTRRFTYGNVAGLATFFALAQVSKFTALLLGPIVVVLLLIPVLRGSAWYYQFRNRGELRSLRDKMLAMAGVIVLLAVISYIAVWAVYGFRYGPTTPSADLARVQNNPEILNHVHTISAIANWFDEHRLLPDTYVHSLILSQVKAQRRSAYFAGEFSRTGWWYYFLVAFLVKTPLTVLMLFICGLVLSGKMRGRWKNEDAFLILPLVIYLGIAMTVHLNIGLRHILPMYPLVLLVCGITLEEMRVRWRPVFLAVPIVFAAVELGLVYPHCLAFFNQLIGGPRNGHLVLLDSNLDWGQDLKPLKQWMDAHHVEEINLGYFGTADPAYYGIHATPLIGSPLFLTAQITEPHLPGYVAVSVQNLHGVWSRQATLNFYEPLLNREPTAVIGYSIHVYWVKTNWWYTPQP
jgi:4-amino-4-deoxy-L-arabinose transferase-like glycosyltransferase